MGKVFHTQTYLRIESTYTADISSNIASVKMKYRKPDGHTGEFVATHDADNKKIYYDLPTGSPLGQYNNWVFWGYAVMNDGRVIPGEPYAVKIYAEGY